MVLVLNAGSSSHKCCLFSGDARTPLWQAHMQWKEGFSEAFLEASTENNVIKQPVEIHSAKEGLEILLNTLWEEPLKVLADPSEVMMVGHRVVHGGEKFIETVQISEAVKKEIDALSYLAPLHNPANLAGIETAEKLFPNAPQFAVFDTAFHATLSESAATYPGPYEWREMGIKRFGFHGISHQYCSKRGAEFLNRDLNSLKIVVCHLGAGASLCAVQDGKSIDTTMGFTPLEGLMMASRSGTIDPGIIFHLLRQTEISPEKLEEVLNKESGLLGISGVSEDMRDVLTASQTNERAKLAVDLFVHRLKGLIATMIASLEGIDLLIFTAGIGEHSPIIRERTCEAFSFLGLKLDSESNNQNSLEDREISTQDSKVKVLVIPTQEEWEIRKESLINCFPED